MGQTELLNEITRCKNFSHCIENNDNKHNCSKIVLSQCSSNDELLTLNKFHLPEPWSGDIEKAPILFIGSNPSICKDEMFPNSGWSEEDIHDFFIHRFSGGKKLWVKNYLYPMNIDGYKKEWVRFWASVRQTAFKIANSESIFPGIDYAITELVHCKSSSEDGVKEAMDECSTLYLERILKISKARIIVCLGKLTENQIKARYNIDTKDKAYSPVKIGDVQKLVIFLPHPSARKSRRLCDYVSEEDIIEIRKYLG